MQYFPAALQELTDQFARLPGIGGKTAQRLAFYVLGLPADDAQSGHPRALCRKSAGAFKSARRNRRQRKDVAGHGHGVQVAGRDRYTRFLEITLTQRRRMPALLLYGDSKAKI